MSVKRLLVQLILVCVAVAIVGFGICVYIGVSTSVHAENTLHAMLSTIQQVDRFVEAKRRWPTSWSELKPFRAEKDQLRSSWEVEVARRRSYIQIDFNANLDEVASQTPKQFRAIAPTGAYYPYWDYGCLTALIETARKAANTDEATEASAEINATSKD